MANLTASSGTSLIQIPLLSPDAPYCFRSWCWQRTNDLVPDSGEAGVLLPLWQLSNGDTLCSTHRWLLSGRVIKDHLPPPFPISHNRLFISRATLPHRLLFFVQAVPVLPCASLWVLKAAALKFKKFGVMSIFSFKDISVFSVCLEMQASMPGECS